jgi:diguanylate cyclase (GGDEF)-like protein
MPGLRRAIPFALSVILVLATGALGVALSSSAGSKSASLHRSDRAALQVTLASLGKQYVLFSIKEGLDYASSGEWSLRSGDQADASRLQTFVSHAVLLNYGAALVGLDGRTLNSYVTGPGLPPSSDPGYRPMIAALTARQPDISSVMKVGSIPVVAMAVPVKVGGQLKALFVGYVRLDRSPLETYVQSIHYGKTGKAYVVDSNGIVAASSDPSKVGRSIGQPRAIQALNRNVSGDYTQRGSLISYSPFGIGGWSGLTIQASAEFFGPIHASNLRVEVAITALLAIASVLIIVLGYKREVARRKFQEQLAFQAYHDSLTGLANRAMLLERLNQALSRARRQNRAVAVLYLDLDRFKVINDTHGHEVGDAVLAEIGRRLQQVVRLEDTVGRMGGDEFAIITEDLGSPPILHSLRSLAERIVTGVGRPFVIRDLTFTVGASVGVAVSRSGHDDVETMLRDADLAMYRAKDSGRSGYLIAGEHEVLPQPQSAPLN